MISSIVNGEVLDWNWKRYDEFKFTFLFYVGDIYIGQVFNGGSMGWSAQHREWQTIGLVEGFKTRYSASHFLLKFEQNILY